MSALPPDPFSTPSQPPPGFQPVGPPSGPTPPDDGAAGRRPVRWGMGDVLLGIGLGLLLTAMLSVVLLAAGLLDAEEDPSLGITAVLQVPLWGAYFGVAWWAARTKGNGMVADFGLRMRWSDLLYLLAGVGLQVLVGLLWAPLADALGIDGSGEAAQELSDRADGAAGIVLFVLIVAVGAPIVEEVFFRGLLLRSLENRWGTVAAVVLSGLFFGAIHFQPADLPPLAVVGVVLALITVRTARLGPAIWTHVGFNGIAAVALLAA